MPASNPQQVAHDVALLLAVHLGHVLVGTHLEGLLKTYLEDMIKGKISETHQNMHWITRKTLGKI